MPGIYEPSMYIDIRQELDAWLSTDKARIVIAEIFRDVFRQEIKSLLMDDLVDSAEAAEIMNMSVGALRKAVERGQVPFIKVGRRLRFRRADLLQR